MNENNIDKLTLINFVFLPVFPFHLYFHFSIHSFIHLFFFFFFSLYLLYHLSVLLPAHSLNDSGWMPTAKMTGNWKHSFLKWYSVMLTIWDTQTFLLLSTSKVMQRVKHKMESHVCHFRGNIYNVLIKKEISF